MAKRCLPRAIPSRSPRVQVKTSRQPQSVEKKRKHDSGILGILRTIETDIKELKDLHKKTREETRALGEEMRARSDELTILSPLKPLAVSIQDGSFATFQSGEPVGEIEDHLASWIESNIEPAADVVTDVCMFKNGLLHDNVSFTALYGVDWQAAKELIGTPLHFYSLSLATAISDTKWF